MGATSAGRLILTMGTTAMGAQLRLFFGLGMCSKASADAAAGGASADDATHAASCGCCAMCSGRFSGSATDDRLRCCGESAMAGGSCGAQGRARFLTCSAAGASDIDVGLGAARGCAGRGMGA